MTILQSATPRTRVHSIDFTGAAYKMAEEARPMIHDMSSSGERTTEPPAADRMLTVAIKMSYTRDITTHVVAALEADGAVLVCMMRRRVGSHLAIDAEIIRPARHSTTGLLDRLRAVAGVERAHALRSPPTFTSVA